MPKARSLDQLTGYARKTAAGERPYIYSDQYADWRRVVASNNDRRVAEANREWLQRFAPEVFERPRRFGYRRKP